MKILPLTRFSQWAYISAVIAFIIMGFWVILAVPKSKDLPPVSAASPQAVVSPADRCLITIDGQKYDVSLFRFQHQGGDVFNCGTVMSAEFHARHPSTFLNLMIPFKV